MNNRDYYNARYTETPYMDEWKGDEKFRVKEIIKQINLPLKGRVLDYGCGNGVFTQVLAEALPKWEICGCDVSDVAIAHAQKRYPNCTFSVEPTGKFDFIFSHHVLEHVENVEETAKEIQNLLKSGGNMLHILPCGNEGSLEWNISARRKNGIDYSREGRFFYEEEGHLRRLTTARMNQLFPHSRLMHEWYSNSFWGAVFWITNGGNDIIFTLTEGRPFLRLSFITLRYAQMPYKWYGGVKAKKDKRLKHYAFLVVDFIPQFFSGFIVRFLHKKTTEEWQNDSQKKSGSGMYLHYISQH